MKSLALTVLTVLGIFAAAGLIGVVLAAIFNPELPPWRRPAPPAPPEDSP